MNTIQTYNLTKRYGSARGIEQVNLSVKQGDFFGFIGPNGAGKSTTIRLLLGLLRPTDGNASIFGLDTRNHMTEILARVGYLPSETAFYPKMRVRDLLQFSANLRNTDCRQEAENLCERLQLDPTRKIHELSLGNRKKVGIIAALQHNPELYIMDEPTSGLDPLMQREFYTILQERNAEGATVFLSSHTLSEVEKYCRNAAIISEGQLVACDSIDHFGHTGVKQVCLQGVTQLPNMVNVENVTFDGNTATFFYRGNPQELLQQLLHCQFDDLTIADTDLEDVFLQYYKKEEE